MKSDLFKYFIATITCIISLIIFLYMVGDIFHFVDFDTYAPFNEDSENFATYSFQKLTNDIPRIDSAVATYPFSSKLVETITNKESYSGNLLHVSTQEAYQDIIDNKVDISIVSETKKEQRKMIDSLSGDVKLIPFAKEALIFYTNEKSGIDNLMIDNIQQIYNLEIKNWNELSGNNIEISPCQLNKDVGGSEECFSRIVSNNLSSSIKRNIAIDMKNIIDKASSRSGGIGYAFNMFYSKMYRENLKMIKIEGIEPTKENIVSGKYPLMYNVYFIYRESNQNPNIKSILDWLLSDEGQYFVSQNGYQPINK